VPWLYGDLCRLCIDLPHCNHCNFHLDYNLFDVGVEICKTCTKKLVIKRRGALRGVVMETTIPATPADVSLEGFFERVSPDLEDDINEALAQHTYVDNNYLKNSFL
jgi:hypothetical protein